MNKENEICELEAELATMAEFTELQRAEILYEALQMRPLNPFISPAQLVRWARYEFYKRTGALLKSDWAYDTGSAVGEPGLLGS